MGFISDLANRSGLGRDTELGKLYSDIADPLDLSGLKAEETQGQVSDLILKSTREGISQQREQLSELERLNAPFREEALETSLPSLVALATGKGETGFKQSKLFQLQADQGTRAIKRRLASQGKFASTQRQEETADLLSGLSSEDLSRFEAGNLAQLQAGIGSTEALNAASETLGSAGEALFSGAGSRLNAAALASGAQRQASLQGGANALSGLSTFLNQPQQNRSLQGNFAQTNTGQTVPVA